MTFHASFTYVLVWSLLPTLLAVSLMALFILTMHWLCETLIAQIDHDDDEDTV